MRFEQRVTKAINPAYGLVRYEMSLTSGEEGLGEFTRNIRAVLIWLVSSIPIGTAVSAGTVMTIPLVNRELIVCPSWAGQSPERMLDLKLLR